MAEGGLKAPMRHPIDWRNPDFYDEGKLDAEMRRVFDICHGCRRCFNLCDSFPRLFDLIDETESGEVEGVQSADLHKVVDACTLCDMCFMTKCPYVPPHEFNLDFPHLMLRWRAVESRKGQTPFAVKQLTATDRNGKAAALAAPVANWASKRGNKLTRPLLEKAACVHRDAALPEFSAKTFVRRQGDNAPTPNPDGPAFGRKAVLYATCFANYNNPIIGRATLAILAHNGVQADVSYPECCGMPQLEQGDLPQVADKAARVARALRPWIESGHDVVALIPSCALMLKFEWPLILPDNEDVRLLSKSTADVSEYIVSLAAQHGTAPGLKPLDGPVSLHIACHARAQNMGRKAEDLLRLIPDLDLKVVERCSGHGGSWGIMKDNFPVGMKVGRPVFRQMYDGGAPRYIVSECPLAGLHIAQGVEDQLGEAPPPKTLPHPVVLAAQAWGLQDTDGPFA